MQPQPCLDKTAEVSVYFEQCALVMTVAIGSLLIVVSGRFADHKCTFDGSKWQLWQGAQAGFDCLSTTSTGQEELTSAIQKLPGEL